MRSPRLPLLLLSLVLVACSPTLNWRVVQAGEGELKAMLPCKPDTGRRQQELAGQTLTVQMLGCEAGDALFAISVTDLGDESRAPAVQVQWQTSLLGTMLATRVKTGTYTIRGAGAGAALAPVSLQASGLRPDGRPVAMHGVWFARGTRLYHAVIYAEHIRPELSEPFFGGLALQ